MQIGRFSYQEETFFGVVEGEVVFPVADP
ncbi:MAG: Rv2993c-like domain-containing protein, partial [Bacillota bacterium]